VACELAILDSSSWQHEKQFIVRTDYFYEFFIVLDCSKTYTYAIKAV